MRTATAFAICRNRTSAVRTSDEALADPATREAAIAEFRRVLTRSKSVVAGLEFVAKVNREIGAGSGQPEPGGVTIIFQSNVDPMKLRAAASRALPLVFRP